MSDYDSSSGNSDKSEPYFSEQSGPIDISEKELSFLLDTILEILADRRRRFVVYTLIDKATRAIEFELLVESVLELEEDVLSKKPEEHHRKGIAADLEHWHLPVLEELGLIEFDERSETIRYWSFSQLEEWSILLREKELQRQ